MTFGMVGSQYPDKKEPLDFRRFFSFIYCFISEKDV